MSQIPDRSFEGIVLMWDGFGTPGKELVTDEIRRRVQALCQFGLAVVLIAELELEKIDPVLFEATVSPGALYLATRGGSEVYKREADGPELIWRRAEGGDSPGDATGWALQELRGLGIGPGLVLVVGTRFDKTTQAGVQLGGGDRVTSVSIGDEDAPSGVIHVPGSPSRLVEILEAQLARRREGRVPNIDEDPRWTIAVNSTSSRLREAEESLLTVANGVVGSRGGFAGTGDRFGPRVVANGIYGTDADDLVTLLPAPDWTAPFLNIEDGNSQRRVLDLFTGVLIYEVGSASVRSARFASLDQPNIVALRAEAPEGTLKEGPALDLSELSVAHESGHDGAASWARTSSNLGGSIAAAASEQRRDVTFDTLERLAYYEPDPKAPADVGSVVAGLYGAESDGFDRLLARHRVAWARRWDSADVSIDGDPELELAARFALFHLQASAGDQAETAVGARGMTGAAYRGHVFWDTDVFVLPALCATHPPSARAVLEYRIRRLPEARLAAEREGRSGARFPWESAHDGFDVTPETGLDERGRIMPILTGEKEIHIVADVAWAAHHYTEWTADRGFLDGSGRSLITDTARYWESRIELDDAGQGHISDVIGPDEYHESVADNAFTNVMAKWNLRRAAELVQVDGWGGTTEEAGSWLDLAESLADGYDPETGIYEQFVGFSDLDPLIITEITDPPVAADLLLGRDRVAASQIVKQADVLMLHHLIPDEMVPNSLVPNLEFYDPRTAHGSSLSPAIHASLLARAGETQRALEMLRIAARIDLADLTGTTAGGLHLATMGGVWQALAFGFAGLHARNGVLSIDPRLPDSWQELGLRLHFRGARVRLGLRADSAEVHTDRPIVISWEAGTETPVDPPGSTFVLRGTWRKAG